MRQHLSGELFETLASRQRTISPSGGTLTLDLSLANNWFINLDQDVTSIVLATSVPSGYLHRVRITFVQDAIGGRTVSGWPASVTWSGDITPVVNTSPGARDSLVLETSDEGASYFGFMELVRSNVALLDQSNDFAGDYTSFSKQVRHGDRSWGQVFRFTSANTHYIDFAATKSTSSFSSFSVAVEYTNIQGNSSGHAHSSLLVVDAVWSSDSVCDLVEGKNHEGRIYVEYLATSGTEGTIRVWLKPTSSSSPRNTARVTVLGDNNMFTVAPGVLTDTGGTAALSNNTVGVSSDPVTYTFGGTINAVQFYVNGTALATLATSAVASDLTHTSSRPSAVETNAADSLNALLLNPFQYGADLATSESADHSTPLNDMATAAQGTADANNKTYEAFMTLAGYRWLCENPLNYTVFRNRRGITFGHGWLLGHHPGIVLDLTGSNGTTHENLFIHGDSTTVPSAGIVSQRYDAGGGTVPGHGGPHLRGGAVTGEFGNSCIAIYGGELMSWDGVLCDNKRRDTNAYSVILAGYVDAERSAVPVPGSTFQTNVSGSRSFMRAKINKLYAFRINAPGTTITNISNSNPAVVTYTGADPTGSNFVFENVLRDDGAGGTEEMTEATHTVFPIANINTVAKTFELQGIDSTGWGNYNSGGTVYYQTGPAVLINRSSWMEVDTYNIVYGAPGIICERHDSFGDEGLKLNTHTEGAGIQAIVEFRCNNGVYNIPELEITENAVQANDAWIKVTPGGASGKLVLPEPRIIINRVHTAPKAGVKLFDVPASVEIYNGHISIPSASYFTVGDLGHFTGWVHEFDTGVTTYYPRDRVALGTAVPFTPEFTFSGAGDLTVSYSVQAGHYVRTGNVVEYWITLSFTPNYTNSSGAARIVGLPWAAQNVDGLNYSTDVVMWSRVVWDASDKLLGARIRPGLPFIDLVRNVDSGPTANQTTAHYPSGTEYALIMSGKYLVS